LEEDMKMRILKEARLISEGRTLDQVSEIVGMSRSRIHTHMRKLLPLINQELYQLVDKVLVQHRKEAPARGAAKTKQLREEGLL
jgi:predicted transcriptional regulator